MTSRKNQESKPIVDIVLEMTLNKETELKQSIKDARVEGKKLLVELHSSDPSHIIKKIDELYQTIKNSNP